MFERLTQFLGITYLILFEFKWDRFRKYSFNPDTDVLDLRGKVAIVTGSNGGIGYHTIKHLARRGATVYMASRNESKALAAITQLSLDGLGPGNGEVKYLKLDLEDPQSVRQAISAFCNCEGRLDILVNNAALLLQEPPLQRKGILEQMLVNHISTFVWTQGLLPLMQKTAGLPNSHVRIVNVSSDAHLFTPHSIRFRNLEDLNVKYADSPAPYYSRYCATKLANVLYAKELQRRLSNDGHNITVMSLHPGNVNTFSHVSPYPRITEILMRLLFLSPDVGSYTSVFAAASPDVDGDERYKGGYLRPIARLEEASAQANDPILARELWETTEKVIAELGL
ncbi:NAD-P-binding protein [Irpex lacteus]|nr:NAD-P-binding protein [Irpex lacteus]